MPVPNVACLSAELWKAGLSVDDYVLVGTTVMWLHQLLLRVGDIDMFVSEDGYAKLKSRGWDEEWPTEGDPPMLAWNCDGQRVNAWHRWDDRHIGGEIVAEAFANREFVNGFPCVSLVVLKRWKAIAARPKDITHIALIEGRERKAS